MVAVDHCEADTHNFGLGAFDDWEEFAVAAGAPDDFLCAHCCFVRRLCCPSVVNELAVGLRRNE
jgi:hypothetical protein